MVKRVPNIFRIIFLIFILNFCSQILADSTVSPSELIPLQNLILRQKDVHSLSADFTQTRSLRVLRNPLVGKGKFWFQVPSSFRWELGNPPQRIVIGSQSTLLIVQPLKKQAEKVPLSGSADFDSDGITGIFSLLGKGSVEEFQKRVEVISIQTSLRRCHVEMLPHDAKLAEGLSSIRLDFDPLTETLISMELVTREGSSILTEFSNIEINPVIPKTQFEYSLKDFKIHDEAN